MKAMLAFVVAVLAATLAAVFAPVSPEGASKAFTNAATVLFIALIVVPQVFKDIQRRAWFQRKLATVRD